MVLTYPLLQRCLDFLLGLDNPLSLGRARRLDVWLGSVMLTELVRAVGEASKVVIVTSILPNHSPWKLLFVGSGVARPS